MQAALAGPYGPPETIRIAEIPTPEPRAGEVLLRVVATPVTAGDARIRAGRFPPGFGLLARLGIGMRGPRRPVLGVVCSGVVEQGGPGADGPGGLAPGDAVVGMTGARMGAHAEHLAVGAARLVPKPAGVSHAQAAAALFGGTTALYFLRDRAGVQPGQRVLVNGASGSVGSAAVQLARFLGAEVTAVTSGRNRELVSALGATDVIDYTARPVAELRGDYDVVFDAVGNITRADGPRLLTPDGALVLAVAGLAGTLRARGRVHAGAAPERPEDFALLLDLVAQGRFDPLVRTLDGLGSIPEAHRLVDSGRKVGNLVVRLES
jgi:NADPH:quinone reductase-like Zn-dependent oxidoreductase